MKTLIANGDSWTYGSELFDPKILATLGFMPPNKVVELDFNPANHSYRLRHAYPYLLAKKFNATSINLAYAGDNNNYIAERTLSYVLQNNLQGSDNFVVIGWTAPERNDFYMNVGSDEFRHKIHNLNFYEKNTLYWKNCQGYKDYLLIHFQHLILPEEYWLRYVKNVIMVEMVLKSRNIPYLMFNAFYPKDYKDIHGALKDLHDVNVLDSLESLRTEIYTVSQDDAADIAKLPQLTTLALWKQVDPVRWYKKDQLSNSFRSFVADRLEDPFVTAFGHPREESHELWAEELARYINEHNLWQ